MRPIRTLLVLLPFTLAPLLAQAQRPAPTAAPARPAAPVARPAAGAGLSLQQVRDSFSKSDADRSGGLDAAEALASGLDAAGFASADLDADQRLSQDEFVVGSEGRAARQAGGAAADLTAESTRLQALRRAQKSEDLKSRREAAPVTTPGAARSGAARAANGEPLPAEPAASGPGAARRAAAAAESPADREKKLQEIRDSIARRLRNGELSSEQAQEAYAALDRRIANALGEGAKPAAGAADASKKELDLKAIEEGLNRRLRNSELDPAKAQEVFGDVSRRIDNAQGEGAASATAGATAGATPVAGAAAAPAPSLRERVIEAQGELSRRVRNAELTPEQAAAEKEALRKRTENAVEKAKCEIGASASSSDASSATASDAAGASSSSGTAPARARGLPTQAPPPAAGPARRGGDGATPAQPSAPPARGATRPTNPPSAPAAQPAPARPAGQDKPAAPAAPARPAPKPATPPSGGGERASGGR